MLTFHQTWRCPARLYPVIADQAQFGASAPNRCIKSGASKLREIVALTTAKNTAFLIKG